MAQEWLSLATSCTLHGVSMFMQNMLKCKSGIRLEAILLICNIQCTAIYYSCRLHTYTIYHMRGVITTYYTLYWSKASFGNSSACSCTLHFLITQGLCSWYWWQEW